MKTPDELIAEIRAVRDELYGMGVKREFINFSRLKIQQLEEIAESIGEQLERRKKFLSVN